VKNSFYSMFLDSSPMFRIEKFLGLQDPDLLVRSKDPEPSIVKKRQYETP
jgi:hypothetical protein